MKQLYKLLLLLLLFTATLQRASGFQTPDSSINIPDTILFKIQKVQNALAEINANNNKSIAVARISADLAKVNTDIKPIKEVLIRKKVIDRKNLIRYQLVLKLTQDKLEGWQKLLTTQQEILLLQVSKLNVLKKDNLLSNNQTDSLSKPLNIDEFKKQFELADDKYSARLDTLNKLISEVVESNALVTELNHQILIKLDKSDRNSIGKESPYIWAAPAINTNGNLTEIIRATFNGQHQILSYFLDATWDNRVLLLLLVAGFFYWVHQNFKHASKVNLREQLSGLNFEFLSPYPFFSSAVILLSILPLFEPGSPALYIELSQFTLLVLLSFHYRLKLDADRLKSWYYIIGLYVCILFVSSIVGSTIWLRLILIFLNLVALYLGRRFFRMLRSQKFSKRYIRALFALYLFFNVLAIVSNVFGRITLATTFSNSAIVAISQVLTLAVFVHILTNAIELQIKVSTASGGLFSRINLSKTRISVKKMLTIVALLLWIIVLLINLSIASGVFTLLQQILTRPRHIGSMTFNLGNLLLFFMIIYVANMLQKYIGLLFGEGILKFDDQIAQKSSKLALVRLIVIFAGVMLAVAASGVPLEKLTVAIGALGVGIGLGLQNIVNNFVSGIILIFEKPFRIGDYIELADRKGKVQDIGIRSSKMLTAQGAEVIIPNGDLLSGRLVNWTLNNDYLKTQVIFKVSAETEFAVLNKMVEDIVNGLEGKVKNLPPEILISNIGADSIELKVMVWIENVYIEQTFKSNLLKAILLDSKTNEIKIL